MRTRRCFLAAAGLYPAVSSAQTTAKRAEPPAKGGDSSLDAFQAAYQGDAARITELQKWNPAVARLRDGKGQTPLHYAVEGGQVGVIQLLGLYGADLSAGPESPLLKAVAYPDRATALAMTQSLTMNGSDPNARAADGRTAIQIAARLGYRDVVDVLAHRGAKGPEADASKSERVYFGKRYAFDIDGNPYVAPDIEGLPQDFLNDFVRLAHGDGPRVKHLLKVVPGLIGARATWDELAIEAAAHMGLVSLARHLADHGAPVSTATATMLGLEDRVEALVKADPACVHERGAHDIALLTFTALGEQRVETADYLLRNGANLAAKALGGMSVLHIAASKGHVELAGVLLAHGADVNEAAASGATPLGVALKSKKDAMAKFLKDRGGRA